MKADDIRRICEANFDIVEDRSRSDEIVFICPEEGCGDHSGNRSVNLRTGMTSCWRCGALRGHSGTFSRWVRRFGISVEESEADLSTVDSEIADLELTLKEDKSTSYVSSVKLPRGFTAIGDDPKCAYSRLIGRMAERKHLHFDDFVKAGVGYTTEDRAWEPYAIFPVVEWGRTVYYQGRIYAKSPEEWMRGTKKFPKRKYVPVGAKNWIYNIDKARNRDVHTLIVVESILNVLSLENELRARKMDGIVPVAVFKHAISEPQRRKILNLGHIKEISLMFDQDAMAASWSSASDLSALRKVSVCTMPVGIDANDDAVVAVDAFQSRQGMDAGSLALAYLNYGF